MGTVNGKGKGKGKSQGKGKGEDGRPRAEAAVRRPDEIITVYDERGRELTIKRVEWVKSVLGPAIDAAWSDPVELSRQIVAALRDDFVEQTVDAAERLVEIGRGSEDSATIAAIVRMETGNLEGAEQLLRGSIERHGPSGTALTNLAKVLEKKGRIAEARAALRRGLDLDPNQDNGLLWWAEIAREERGDAGYVAALEEIAAVPGAWRPQLWLAREQLHLGDRAAALALYDRALADAPEATDALLMATGDLGNAGALEDLVRVGAPRYRPEVQGPRVGLNIVEALKQLGRVEEALGWVRRLQAMGWAPLAAPLAGLETELCAASLPESEGTVPELGAFALDGPLWTRGLYEPDWLLPSRSDGAPLVVVVTFANETIQGGRAGVQMVDDLGRLTRALPLYLSESLLLGHGCRSQCKMLVAKGQGPAVLGQPLSREALARLLPGVESSESSGSRRLVVAGSLVASGAALRIWDVDGDGPPETIAVDASHADVAALVAGIESALVARLRAHGAVLDQAPPAFYRSPPAELLGPYVSALEQLFFQLLAANGAVPAGSLWNERGFFETYFGLADSWPNPPAFVRLLGICGVLAGLKYGSSAVQPYRRIVLGWVDEAPPDGIIAQLAPAILKRLGEQARLDRWLAERAPAPADARYASWLERVKADT